MNERIVAFCYTGLGPGLQPGLWSRSGRLGLETVSRRTNVSSRSSRNKIVNVSVSSRSRPFTSRAQDQFLAKLIVQARPVCKGGCNPPLNLSEVKFSGSLAAVLQWQHSYQVLYINVAVLSFSTGLIQARSSKTNITCRCYQVRLRFSTIEIHRVKIMVDGIIILRFLLQKTV